MSWASFFRLTLSHRIVDVASGDPPRRRGCYAVRRTPVRAHAAFHCRGDNHPFSWPSTWEVLRAGIRRTLLPMITGREGDAMTRPSSRLTRRAL